MSRAHYQPRPRSYTQQLHLAASIVSDLRLDRPREQQLWKVDFKNEERSVEWGSDELRALVGTYYLASRCASAAHLVCRVYQPNCAKLRYCIEKDAHFPVHGLHPPKL